MPIRAAGRFAHEAVDIDPATGILYVTEDNFDFPSGFYRYRAPQNPMQAKRLPDGGTLEMLKIVGAPDAELDKGQTPGVTYGVEWVTIDDPDPTFAPGTTNNQAIVLRRRPGAREGRGDLQPPRGHLLRRGQGLPRVDPGRRHASRRAAPGRLRRRLRPAVGLRRARQTLTLLFESPSRTVLELPDNLCISPRKCSLLCEDGPTENSLRGVTPDGGIFDFARNAIAGRTGEEFAGSTFAPDGKVLFVNIQASSGVTFAIWGPWKRGVL